MSNALRSLSNQGRELSKLLKDVQSFEAASNSLDSAVSTRNSLGRGTTATKWVVAEQFLSSYIEWAQMYDRYYRYFGQPQQLTPRRWQRLRSHCDFVRQRILRYPAFQDLPARLGQDWMGQSETVERTERGMPDSAEDLYHEFVDADVRKRTAMIYVWQVNSLDHGSDAVPPHQSQVLGWTRLAHEIHARQEQLLVKYSEANALVQTEVKELLRNYRHATLRVSWLEENGQGPSGMLLFRIDERRGRQMSALGDFLDAILVQDSPPDLYRIVDRVLGRIADAVHEIGYENLINDVTSNDFLGGDDSPLGSSAINVIPGTEAVKCCSVLVALSRGASRTGRLGFPKILQQVKIHLTQCAAITRVVIVVCDTWDARSFANDHYHELRAHYRNGIRFLFLMIGAPDTSIGDVEVRF